MNRQHIKNKVVIEKGRTTSLSRNVSLPKNDGFVMVNAHSASMNRKALTKFMIRIDIQEYFFISRSSLRFVDWSLCIAISFSILWGLVNEIELIVLVYYIHNNQDWKVGVLQFSANIGSPEISSSRR